MRRLLLLAVLLSVGEAQAQRAAEWQVAGVVVATGDEFVGGGVGIALRPPGRIRLGLAAQVGSRGGTAAVRAEGVLSYHLHPTRRRGLTPYLGGGVAVMATAAESVEFLLVHLGVESAPGGRAGWFFEAGAGGGVRVAAGVRVRLRERR